MIIRNINLDEMARIGWIPSNKSDNPNKPSGNLEVLVFTDDAGFVPHMHIRNQDQTTNVCIKYLEASYFEHGNYKGTLTTKECKSLDSMLRKPNPKDPGRTYWETAVIQWNLNNSSVDLPIDIEQPDYTQLNK